MTNNKHKPPVINWIPCSEELPPNKNNVEYLACTSYGSIYTLPYWNGWNLRPESPKENEIKSVIAWTPLPRPYAQQ